MGKTESIKYLGVILDQEVNWKKHILNLKSKLNNVLRYFYFLNPICNKKILKMLYFSLVHSRINYRLSCWGGTYDTNLKPIYIQQKMFLRIISKKGRMEPSYPLFSDNKVLPLKYMFVFKVLQIFYKVSGNLPEITNLYKDVLRNPKLFVTPRTHLTNFEKCYIFQGPRIYNKLPTELKTCTDLINFSKKLKCWLLSHESIDFLTNIQV